MRWDGNRPLGNERRGKGRRGQTAGMQVQLNLESQRRQCELVEVARRRGFANIEVIDDDLGRTASGAVERPGFDRLVVNRRSWSGLRRRGACGLVRDRRLGS